MFYNKEITIMEDSGYMNEYGRYVEGELKPIKTIECDVQPFSSELAYRDYGYDKDVKYRVFLDPEPLIELGTQVQYQEVFKDKPTIFSVVNIIPWDDYYIILLDN